MSQSGEIERQDNCGTVKLGKDHQGLDLCVLTAVIIEYC